MPKHLPRPAPRGLALLAAALFLAPAAAESVLRLPDLVTVPAGSFLMGTTPDRHERNVDETPHRVSLGAFAIARTEVTLDEFRAFAEATGYRSSAELSGEGWYYTINEWVTNRLITWRNPACPQAGNHPVCCVSWYDAVAYCNWLSTRAGRTPVYRWRGSADTAAWPEGWNTWSVAGFDEALAADLAADGFRLPTEAEWEYACRGGPGAPDQAYSGSDDPDEVGWSKLNAGFGTRPVAGLKPNRLGLYDMSGNVGEWCNDWYGPYGDAPQTDPAGPAEGIFKVVRGGGWYSGYWYFLRSAYRSSSTPDYACTIFGFRLASSRAGGR